MPTASEVKAFLRESWELWLWSLLFPSKLRDRTGDRPPNFDLLEVKPRLFSQFLLVVLVLSVFPWAIALSENSLQGILLLVVPIPFIAYGLAVWQIPLGVQFPLIIGLVYWQNLEGYRSTSIEAFLNLPSEFEFVSWLDMLTKFTQGWTAITITLALFLSVGKQFLKTGNKRVAQVFYWSAGFLSSTLGVWLASDNFIIAAISGVFIQFFTVIVARYQIALAPLVESANKVVENVAIGVSVGVAVGVVGGLPYGVAFGVVFGMAVDVAGGMAVGMAVVVVVGVALSVSFGVSFGVAGVMFGMAGGVAGCVVGGVAVGVVVGVAVGVAGLPWLPFVLACWFIATSAAARNRSAGVVAAGWLTFLTLFEGPGIKTLVAPSVALIGYFHIFPGYLAFAALSQLSALPARLKQLKPSALRQLHWLPPYTSEWLWLPLPNHDRILAAACREDASAGLTAYQYIQQFDLPGFRSTLQKARPQIVADCFAAPISTPDLIATASPKHPILPILAPSFYPTAPEENSPPIDTTDLPELQAMVPRLQNIARDLDAALQGSTAPIRERGLERIANNLPLLAAQIPGLVGPAAARRWQPVITCWQRLLDRELAHQRQQSPGEILNPFLFGNPVPRSRAALFQGRQALKDRILRLLLTDNRPTLVLHGPRRCGKTSLLLNLPRLFPSDILSIYVDLQAPAATRDEASFCYSLARAIAKDARSQGLQLPTLPPRTDFTSDPYIALEDWLDAIQPALANRFLLIALDEFEKLGDALNKGQLSEAIFDQLRHLIQHAEKLGFLFSGVRTLDELGPRWSNYFISVQPLEILYLDPDEARNLLLHPDPDFTLQYAPGIVDRIVEQTRCHPYLLQLIGGCLVNRANLHKTQRADLDLLHKACSDAYTEGSPYFDNLWREFTGTTPTEVAAGQTILRTLALDRQPQIVTESDRAALSRLLRYHIIEPVADASERYRIEIPFVAQWVRDRAPAERSY